MDQETHRRRLIIFAAALAAIGATYAAVLVAQEEEMDKAIWCPRETAALVDYLHQRSFEVGNGGNFKNGTFNEAAGVIKPFLEAVADKAGMHCKTRWEKIKTIYAAIRKYQNIPGTHWDNENGAGIEGSSAAAVWDSYVSQKGNSRMKKFRNSGWEYYDKVHAIMLNDSGAVTSVSMENDEDDAPTRKRRCIILEADQDSDANANLSCSGGSTNKRKCSARDDTNQSQLSDSLSMALPPSTAAISSPAASTPDTLRRVPEAQSAPVAIYGLQTVTILINRLIDVIHLSITQASLRPLTSREQAINLINTDDFLTHEQKFNLLNMLIAQPAATSEEILQSNLDLRRRLYIKMLREMGNNVDANKRQCIMLDKPRDDTNQSQLSDLLSMVLPPSTAAMSSPAASTPDTLRRVPEAQSAPVAIYGLQTVINRLIDVIHLSITQASLRPLTAREQAINLISTDDFLTQEQKFNLLNMLIAQPAATSEGILQSNLDLRRRLYIKMLGEMGNNGDANSHCI